MERIIHLRINDVFDVRHKEQKYDKFNIEEGDGRAVYENGYVPDFQEKMTRFDLLIRRKIPVDLGPGETELLTLKDLKCRYDGHSRWKSATKGRSFLTINIGPTSWHEWKQDYNRSPGQAEALQKLGLKEDGDRGHYLSNCLGAAIITMAKEGDVIVGVRKSDSYDGAIHCAAGWMTFNRNVKKINPFDDARRELNEELAIPRDSISALHLIGLVAYPKTLEADFVFLAKTDKEREYFTSGAWKEAVDVKEHRDLVVLDHPEKINRLLREGKVVSGAEKTYEVLPSTAYGLEMLAQYWEKVR